MRLISWVLFGSHRLSKYKWACPNCGHHFYAKWYKFIYAPGKLFETPALKCPKCKIKDSCSIARH